MEQTNNPKPGFLVYVIAGAVIAVLFIVNSNRVPVLSASQLLQLIRNSERDPGTEGFVDGKDGTLTITSDSETITYSNLRDVHLRQDRITGTLDVTTLDDVKRENEENVPFAALSVSEQWNMELVRLLERTNINYFGDDGPDFWERNGFFLIVMFLLFMIVLFMIRRSPRTTPTAETGNGFEKSVTDETRFGTFVDTKTNRGWIVQPDADAITYLVFFKFGMHNEYKAFEATANPGIVQLDQLGMPVTITTELSEKNDHLDRESIIKLRILKVE